MMYDTLEAGDHVILNDDDIIIGEVISQEFDWSDGTIDATFEDTKGWFHHEMIDVRSGVCIASL